MGLESFQPQSTAATPSQISPALNLVRKSGKRRACLHEAVLASPAITRKGSNLALTSKQQHQIDLGLDAKCHYSK
jgi:hypothetical protein